MSELKEQEVYVPINVDERLPKDGDKGHFVIYGSGSRGTLHKRNFHKWVTKQWLEPHTGFFHTKDQLIELANRIWEASEAKLLKVVRYDKETFINSLFEKEESNG